MLIGYVYVGPGDDSHVAAQRQALAEAGCEQIVEDRLSSDRGGGQAELHSLLARLHPGDMLLVVRLDNLGRSPRELAGRVQQVTAAGAGLRSLAEALQMAEPSRRRRLLAG